MKLGNGGASSARLAVITAQGKRRATILVDNCSASHHYFSLRLLYISLRTSYHTDHARISTSPILSAGLRIGIGLLY